jgi:hypothetical protein
VHVAASILTLAAAGGDAGDRPTDGRLFWTNGCQTSFRLAGQGTPGVLPLTDRALAN